MSEDDDTIRILPHGKVVAFGVKDNVTRDVAGRLSENDVALEKALQKVLNDLNTALPRQHDDGTWHVGTSDTDVTIMGPQGEKGEKGDTGPAGADGAAGAAGAAGADGADGADGVTPSIGVNGNWYIGETDTGVQAEGQDGADGQGVPAGGTTGQALVKASATDYDTEWVDQSGGAAEDPGTSIDTLGAASEGSETASTATWTAGGTNGLAEWYVSRVVYNHSGDKKLYAFLRKRTYDSYGRLYSVGAETRVIVDEPTVLS